MVDHEPVEESSKQETSGAALAKELLESKHEDAEVANSDERLKVVEGLTEVRPGQIELGQNYRFLITAAVQSSPHELGNWLQGDGNGFRATERPVNASLIDQDHNWTFAGENGFILAPPEDGSDVIAAAPTDIGSNDLEPQPLSSSADDLLQATSETGYNQVNIASGQLQGVFVRQNEQGQDLGNPRINEQLRDFAEQQGLPVVEIPVEPKQLEAGAPEIHQLEAKAGNNLWKIVLPGDGVRREIDVIKFKPGESAKGMKPDKQGFDFRIQELDEYGSSKSVDDLNAIKSELEKLTESMPSADREPIDSVIRRINNEEQHDIHHRSGLQR